MSLYTQPPDLRQAIGGDAVPDLSTNLDAALRLAPSLELSSGGIETVALSDNPPDLGSGGLVALSRGKSGRGTPFAFVERSDPRYFDVKWTSSGASWVPRFFAAPEAGETDIQARLRQIRDIEVAGSHFKDNPRFRGKRSARPAGAGPRQGGSVAFPLLLPARPHCTDYFGKGVVRRDRSDALKRRHIEFNRVYSFDWLIFDIDRPDAYMAAEDAKLPAPTVITVDPQSGRGHLAYLLKTPVLRFKSSRRKPLEFLADVQRGMRRRLKADPGYSGFLSKNPLHCDWRTDWPAFNPYTLEGLDCALEAKDKRPEARIEVEAGEGRNCALFNELRKRAYREGVKRLDDMSGLNDRLLAIATDMNAQFTYPLSAREVGGIVRSVSKWIERNFSREAFTEIQRARANRRWAGHTSVAEKAKALGISPRTLYRRQKAGLLP